MSISEFKTIYYWENFNRALYALIFSIIPLILMLFKNKNIIYKYLKYFIIFLLSLFSRFYWLVHG